MSEEVKTDQVEEVSPEVQKEKPKHYKVGDLTFKCGQCGNSEILQKDIPGGISFILATIEGAEVKMKCGECENECTLLFTGMSDERDVEFDLKEKEMQEAIKLEQEEAATVELTEEEVAAIQTEADKLEAELEDEVEPVLDAETEVAEEAVEEEVVA